MALLIGSVCLVISLGKIVLVEPPAGYDRFPTLALLTLSLAIGWSLYTGYASFVHKTFGRGITLPRSRRSRHR
jgi:hypothetical protein